MLTAHKATQTTGLSEPVVFNDLLTVIFGVFGCVYTQFVALNESQALRNKRLRAPRMPSKNNYF